MPVASEVKLSAALDSTGLSGSDGDVPDAATEDVEAFSDLMVLERLLTLLPVPVAGAVTEPLELPDFFLRRPNKRLDLEPEYKFLSKFQM